MMEHLFGSATMRTVRESQHPADADGWVEVLVPLESMEYAYADLLPLGAEIEVLGPPSYGSVSRRLSRRCRQSIGVHWRSDLGRKRRRGLQGRPSPMRRFGPLGPLAVAPKCLRGKSQSRDYAKNRRFAIPNRCEQLRQGQQIDHHLLEISRGRAQPRVGLRARGR